MRLEEALFLKLLLLLFKCVKKKVSKVRDQRERKVS